MVNRRRRNQKEGDNGNLKQMRSRPASPQQNPEALINAQPKLSITARNKDDTKQYGCHCFCLKGHVQYMSLQAHSRNRDPFRDQGKGQKG
ncbi:unnamed protein product [Boreogadus saida]